MFTHYTRIYIQMRLRRIPVVRLFKNPLEFWPLFGGMYLWIGLRNCDNGWYHFLMRNYFWIGVSWQFLLKWWAFLRRIRVLLGIVNFIRFWRRCLDGWSGERGFSFDEKKPKEFHQKVQCGPLPVINGVISYNPLNDLVNGLTGVISPYFLEIISPHW